MLVQPYMQLRQAHYTGFLAVWSCIVDGDKQLWSSQLSWPLLWKPWNMFNKETSERQDVCCKLNNATHTQVHSNPFSCVPLDARQTEVADVAQRHVSVCWAWIIDTVKQPNPAAALEVDFLMNSALFSSRWAFTFCVKLYLLQFWIHFMEWKLQVMGHLELERCRDTHI